MMLEKRQKMLIATFVLGLIGLVIDQVFLRPGGGPRTASADAFEQYGVPASPEAPAPEPPSDQPTVAARLERLWSGSDVNDVETRDPFCLAGSWQASPTAGLPPAPDEAAVFAKNHRLVAVVVDGPQSCALVNDRVLKPGDPIGGYTLVSVGPKSAVFDRQGRQIVLELATK